MAKQSGFNSSDLAVNPKEMSLILKDLRHYVENGIIPPSIYMVGAPGIGKTMITEDAFSDWVLHEMVMQTIEPTDIAGIPGLDITKGLFRYCPEERFYQASTAFPDGSPTVFFLDEFPHAAPQVQNAAGKFIHERRAGIHQLRKNVLIIAAGNRPEDRAAVNDLPTFIANRFRFYYVEPDKDSWIEWAVDYGIYPSIVGYHRKNENRLLVFDPDSDEKPYASPRTWHKLSDTLKLELEILGRNKVDFRTIAGQIGQGVALEFESYLETHRSAVPIEEIKKDPLAARMPKDAEIDALYATICNAEYHLGKKPSDWEPLCIYDCRDDMLDELGIVLAQRITQAILKLSGDNMRKAAMSDTYKVLREKYGKYL